MGCCLTNHNQHDAIIQNIIEQTVLEQQQIKIEEVNSERIRTTLNSDQDLLNSDDGANKQELFIEHHVKKSSHHKRGFEKKENHNYLRKVDYNVKLKQIIVELIKTDNSQFYKVQFTASYLDFDVMVDLKGVQVNEQHHHLQIYPQTYQEASRSAKYDCFFKSDKYFNFEDKDSKKQYIFEKLLLVERHVLKNHQKSASSQEKRVVNRRWGLIANMVGGPNLSLITEKRSNNQQCKLNVVYELMEAIQVFDIEVNPRFLNMMFHLMMQNYYPILRESLVFIEEVYFLFNDLPHLDCPQYYRLLIFYQGMNYSLKELHTHLDLENLILSDLCLYKISYCLLKIFDSCYSKYLYRLNFTLSNIYYFRRLKQFRLQSFQRISSLIPFQPNVESSVNCISEAKMTTFKKCFVKDYLAICDIFVLFKNPRGYNQKIISRLRKKKTDNTKGFEEYLTYIESIFDETNDKILIEFIKTGLNLSQVGMEFDYFTALSEFRQFKVNLEVSIITQEQLIKKRQHDHDHERMREQQQQDCFEVNRKLSSSSSGSNDENLKTLKSFDIEIVCEANQIIFDSEIQKQELEIEQLKREMIYSSLLMNKFFTRNCQNYLRKQIQYSTARVQALIYLAQAKSQEIVDEKERKNCYQNLLESAISLSQKNENLSLETANFLVLIQLLQFSTRKPQTVILQLLKLFQLQQRNKYKIRRKIRKEIHSCTGLIEVRKQVILQLANVEHFFSNSRLNEANGGIFNLIDLQMKKNQQNTLLFGYSLFVYGMICKETIQVQSAMIIFEMCKQIYDTYFPMQKLIEIRQEVDQKQLKKQGTFQLEQKEKELEKPVSVLVNFQNMATYNLSIMAYNSGIVFCLLNDPENALKALQKAIEYRKLLYDEFSDEVIEIVLQIFKIYIENEESSQVIRLAWFYARKVNDLLRENQLLCFHNKNFAKLLFILAGVFQSCNSYFSALRFYSRANRAFASSKTQTFNRMYFIEKQRKVILCLIKDFNLSTDSVQTQEAFFQTKVKSVFDKMKPFFQQTYFINSIQYMDNSLNISIGSQLIYTNGFLKNQDHELAWKRYSEIHKQYQAIQKDECYGYNIEKMGEIYIEKKEFEKAKQQFKFAIGIYERFLFFPIKEYCIMRCNLQIIAILAMQKLPETIIKYFNQVDTFINDCQQFMRWSIMQEERKYNKFQLISKKAGVKILYQLVELLDLIDKFRNVRKRLSKNITDTEYLAQRGEKMQRRLKYHKKENKLMAEFRKCCLTGQDVKIKIKKYEEQIKISSDNILQQKSANDPKEQKVTGENDKQLGQRKSKFFLLEINENTLKQQKQMRNQSKLLENLNTKSNLNQEIQKDNESVQINNDFACSTLETQRGFNTKKLDRRQSKSKTPSLRSNSKVINPFQKVSKKQI